MIFQTVRNAVHAHISGDGMEAQFVESWNGTLSFGGEVSDHYLDIGSATVPVIVVAASASKMIGAEVCIHG